ncbi:hypothetical protein Q5M85_22620 [Paraclostridium bifermentans]|nr:hypothetical protein [Paraclostridium bifermentans]
MTSEKMVGRKLDNIKNDKNIDFIMNEYSKIVNMASVRSGIIQFFVNSVSIILLLSIILLTFRKK